MIINDKTLPAIEAGEGAFVKFLEELAIELMATAALYPILNRQRIVAAHGAWVEDLDRLGHHEKKLKKGPDHFKRAGHLAYWVRRFGPIIDACDPHFAEDFFTNPPTEGQLAIRERLFGFWNEYLAFELGFQFSRFYEAGQPGCIRDENYRPEQDYYETMFQFLKFKNVSPHALFLIYKSIFAK